MEVSITEIHNNIWRNLLGHDLSKCEIRFVNTGTAPRIRNLVINEVETEAEVTIKLEYI